MPIMMILEIENQTPEGYDGMLRAAFLHQWR